ncbi:MULTISPECIES: oligosaccharide flippase family protein [Pseudomonas]|uniref:Polysaccharide biosynthesis protein n=1 Tax=Pseudomonas protegens TaxID=380021 RepID=A0A9Q6IHG9_9PSED|nr:MULTISPECIES: oligosaccharide flippase family protein [Pseudomonas]MCO7577722.1 oligosaccharide flippase family protein [Pseudomonas protegens]MCO7584097.1 oligosaccharide flippase family protein [Pseudomonas chlororaphis]MCO7601105.1 oligosaccharide flippase family protein [Pseudomonas chlororaphis]MDC7817315.1 oligosaccharide flippase family protein [Pseudomonas sp. BLCC-B112]PYC37325.1 hypothetical protein DMX08_13605 [Pseudomonas protegens]
MSIKVGRDIFTYGIGELIFKLLPILILPFIVRNLDQAEFGAAELMLTIMNSFIIFLCFGSGSAIHRYYNDPKFSLKERSEIISTSFLFVIFITTLSLAILFLFYDYLILKLNLYTFKDYKLIFALFIIFSIFGQLTLDVIRIRGEPLQYLLVAGLARIGGGLLCLVFVVFLSFGVKGYLSAPIIATASALIVGILLIRSDLSASFKWNSLRKIVSYGWPFALLAPLQWLISGLDRYLIASDAGLATLGSYAMAAKIATMIGLMFASILSAWGPSAARLQAISKSNFLALHKMVFYGCLTAFFATCLLLHWFSNWGIILLFSEIYSESHYYVLPLVIGSSLPMVSATLYTYISLSGKTYTYILINIAGGGLALILNLILINRIGALGGAISSALVGISIFLLNYFAAVKYGFSRFTTYELLSFALGITTVFTLATTSKYEIFLIILNSIVILYFLMRFFSSLKKVREL